MYIVGKCLVFPESAFIFQHDLAPPHRAKKYYDIPKINNVNDLNPIKNVWSVLKRQLTPMKYTSTEELRKAFQDALYKVPPNICRSLVSSMPKRLQLVKKSRGYSIKY